MEAEHFLQDLEDAVGQASKLNLDPESFAIALKVHCSDQGGKHAILSSRIGHLTAVPLGCVMKPVVGVVAAHTTVPFNLWKSCCVAELLGEEPHLDGLRLEQLLDHTHGLDDSLMPAVPRLPNGLIDSHELVRQLSLHPRLSVAGNIYSYSNAGAWLWAAILERKSETAISRLLEDFWRLVVGAKDVRFLHSRPLCPATEPLQTFPIEAIESFLAKLLSDRSRGNSSHRHFAGPEGCDVVVLPGWSPTEIGVSLGWKVFGGGWYGHNADLEDMLVAVRFHPKLGATLIYAAHGPARYTVYARIFSRCLPEFSGLSRPRATGWTLDDAFHLPLDGTFGNAAVRLSFSRYAETLCCQAEFLDQQAGMKCVTFSLRNVGDGLFFPITRAPLVAKYLQFLSQDSSGSFTHVWNGRNVFPRID